jgi:2-C-methyl-D-erythritol 4-phosphate cytidylyltransferase / 2-C-methyl-D-erythritol 2,4-cyclodiphosphate synthase
MHSNTLFPRMGIGLDFHKVIPCESHFVKICGVPIKCNLKIEAHSDGDVGIHAITEALLGAIANGNIGTHFKNTDPKWKEADSSIFLKHAYQLVKDNGGMIINLDIIIICEEPKIMPYSDAMCKNIAQLLEIKKTQVSVKATTTELMGFLGRGEGIAAMAVSSVMMPITL